MKRNTPYIDKVHYETMGEYYVLDTKPWANTVCLGKTIWK